MVKYSGRSSLKPGIPLGIGQTVRNRVLVQLAEMVACIKVETRNGFLQVKAAVSTTVPHLREFPLWEL